MKQTIEPSQAYSFDNPQARELCCAIGEMVCVNCVPMYTVEKPGFCRLLTHRILKWVNLTHFYQY